MTILLLEKNYGIRIENSSEGKEIFYSVGTLADFIEKTKQLVIND